MQSNIVFVTNTHKEVHSDKYNGEEFYFPPGKQVPISIAAATHMLGYGLKDKTGTLQRLGRAFHQDPTTGAFVDNEGGGKWLAGFVFEAAIMQPASALQLALKEEPPPTPAAPAKPALDLL